MEQQKLLNLLNEANDSKFVKRKWNIFNNNSKSNHDATNEITYKTEILKSNLFDYNEAYILVRGDIIVVAAPTTEVASKCIKKIDKTTINDVEDLVMPINNFIEYSSNYSET